MVIASLGDGLSALNYAAAHKPGLLVIDCNLLDDEVEALLDGVRTAAADPLPGAHTLAPAEGKALAHGADAALPHDGIISGFTGCAGPNAHRQPTQT